jgi:hypothetical protein
MIVEGPQLYSDGIRLQYKYNDNAPDRKPIGYTLPMRLWEHEPNAAQQAFHLQWKSQLVTPTKKYLLSIREKLGKKSLAESNLLKFGGITIKSPDPPAIWAKTIASGSYPNIRMGTIFYNATTGKRITDVDELMGKPMMVQPMFRVRDVFVGSVISLRFDLWQAGVTFLDGATADVRIPRSLILDAPDIDTGKVGLGKPRLVNGNYHVPTVYDKRKFYIRIPETRCRRGIDTDSYEGEFRGYRMNWQLWGRDGVDSSEYVYWQGYRKATDYLKDLILQRKDVYGKPDEFDRDAMVKFDQVYVPEDRDTKIVSDNNGAYLSAKLCTSRDFATKEVSLRTRIFDMVTGEPITDIEPFLGKDIMFKGVMCVTRFSTKDGCRLTLEIEELELESSMPTEILGFAPTMVLGSSSVTAVSGSPTKKRCVGESAWTRVGENLITVECETEGHQTTCTESVEVRGYPCAQCEGYTDENAHKEVDGQDGCTFVRFQDVQRCPDAIVVRCEKNHEFVTTVLTFQSGFRCTVCTPTTMDDLKDMWPLFANDAGYVLKGYDDATGDVTFVCASSHVVTLPLEAFICGAVCHKCPIVAVE